MGEQKVSLVKDKAQMQKFMRHLLNDVKALEHMLDNDMFESDITRIGAEQEMALVNSKTYKPAPLDDEDLDKTVDAYDWLETELARFNLETNLTPRVFKGNCLSALEKENATNLNKIRKLVEKMDLKVILTGILPTLRQSDLELTNLTPKKRYYALMEAIIKNQKERNFLLHLKGIDEIKISHQSPLLEACNTSFQVHLQVAPKEFVKLYNMSQTLTAPVMAIAANSPIVFNKRLWHESRITMFQDALDTRKFGGPREFRPRVSFGDDWLQDSILEIYRDDISRFRVLLAGDVEEDSLKNLSDGKTPKLRALQVHNSTVYRWNRPCYGVSDNGKPHLRIENRVLPAGPTVLDEVANAALWLGAMVGMKNNYDDIRKHLSWEDVLDNFMKAAKFGIDTTFNWFGDQKISACDLVLKEIIPLARQGLQDQEVASEDIDRYLGVIQERAERQMTGARWQLRAFSDLKTRVSTDEAITVLTASIIKNQEEEKPVHTWPMPKEDDLKDYTPSHLKVKEFMDTDLFTVRKDDLIELVSDMMEWRKIRYMPVEDEDGNLEGLVTSRLLLRYFSKNQKKKIKTVKDLMIENPITIGPESRILEAMYLMRDNKIGCLPVVNGKELIGIMTEMDFLRISGRLIERLESE